MDKRHYAGIDIGSNAVRLLIKCENDKEAGEQLSKVQLLRVPLRLGEDAFAKGRIGKKKSRQMLSLMKAFKELMSIYDVVAYRACATSAMRDANNGTELVAHIEEETGIRIEIIAGEEEARLISQELMQGREIASSEVFLYVDVGGGSTELNIVEGEILVASRSFNIGTVRQLGGMVEPEERERFRSYLEEVKARYESLQVVGTGGNINKLLRLGAPSERAKINLLSMESLRSVYQELRKYTSEERMIRFALKPDRTDVIIPAAEIFLTVGEIIQNESIIVPTKGLSDGIVEDVYRHHRGG